MMSEPSQLILDLGRAPAFAASDFVVAGGNAEAMGWIERWPEWPAQVLALCGPAGSGKSHLAHIFAARSRGAVLAAATLRGEIVADLAALPAVAIEDADRGVDEAALLHLYNLARENGRHLLLTGREPPSRWPLRLPDLRSRLAAVPVAAIGAPDDALLGALLLKLLDDRQLRVGPDVPPYLLARLDRSFAAIRRAVEMLDGEAMARHRSITVPFAREVLDLIGEPGPRVE